MKKYSLLFIALIGIYALFEARGMILGPRIELIGLENFSTVPHGVTEIVGKAKNITEISLDGRKIYTDEDGNFKEKLILENGYNILRLDAKDRFGRQTTKTIQLAVK